MHTFGVVCASLSVSVSLLVCAWLTISCSIAFGFNCQQNQIGKLEIAFSCCHSVATMLLTLLLLLLIQFPMSWSTKNCHAVAKAG